MVLTVLILYFACASLILLSWVWVGASFNHACTLLRCTSPETPQIMRPRQETECNVSLSRSLSLDLYSLQPILWRWMCVCKHLWLFSCIQTCSACCLLTKNELILFLCSYSHPWISHIGLPISARPSVWSGPCRTQEGAGEHVYSSSFVHVCPSRPRSLCCLQSPVVQ